MASEMGSVNVVSAVKFVWVEEIPDGDYEGSWGGYSVRFCKDGCEYELTIDKGIRTMKAPCKVRIHEGKVFVAVKERSGV